MLTADQLARLVQDFYSFVLDRENELRLGFPSSAMMPQGMPEEVRAKRQAFYADAAQRSRAALAANRLDEASLVSEAMVRKQGLLNLDMTEKRQVMQAMLRAVVPPGSLAHRLS